MLQNLIIDLFVKVLLSMDIAQFGKNKYYN